MISYDDMDKVLSDLEQMVSHLKSMTETQLFLQKNISELLEIKVELGIAITQIRNLSEQLRQDEKTRIEEIQNAFNTTNKTIELLKDSLKELQSKVIESENRAEKSRKTLIKVFLGSAAVILIAVIIGFFV